MDVHEPVQAFAQLCVVLRDPLSMKTLSLLVGLGCIATATAAFIVACGSDPVGQTFADSGTSATLDSGSKGDVDAPVPVEDAGAISDAAVDVQSDAANCVGGIPFNFVDGGPLLAPSPYKQFSDSPFACKPFASYFHLATFEGDGGLPPGTSGPGSKYPGTGLISNIVDSVDGDDGFPDGAPPDSGSGHPCPGCQSWFGGSPNFTFDPNALGGLPTHVGLVWTDDANNGTVTITAFDGADVMIAQKAFTGIGSSGVSGETDEDRFFGIVYPAGVKRITLTHTGGGYEIDHIQIGR